MKRRLFNLAALVSLLLCAAAMTFWIRSHWITEQVSHLRSRMLPDGSLGIRGVALGVSRGGLGFTANGSRLPAEYLRESGANPNGFYSWPLKYWSPGPARNYMAWGAPEGCIEDWIWGGFQFGIAVPRKKPQFYTRGVFIVVPLWLVAGIAAILPAMRAQAMWRERVINRQRNRGLCSRCGYDLRGSPGPTCPECGAPMPNVSTSPPAP